MCIKQVKYNVRATLHNSVDKVTQSTEKRTINFVLGKRKFGHYLQGRDFSVGS